MDFHQTSSKTKMSTHYMNRVTARGGGHSYGWSGELFAFRGRRLLGIGPVGGSVHFDGHIRSYDVGLASFSARLLKKGRRTPHGEKGVICRGYPHSMQDTRSIYSSALSIGIEATFTFSYVKIKQ